MLDPHDIYEFLDHWKRALLGPVVGIGVLVVEHLTGKPLSFPWFLVLVLAGLAWQCWDELKREKTKKRPENIPELFLEYSHTVHSALHYSGFFLRTDNDRMASNVTISSADTVSSEGLILGLDWESPGLAIGKDRVPIKLRCVYQKDGQRYTYNSVAADQINLFFDHKKHNPRELIVALTYTNVGGHACPTRKFRISQDVWNNRKISCEPVD